MHASMCLDCGLFNKKVIDVKLIVNFVTDIESVGLVVKKEKEEEFISTLENILQAKIVFCNTKDPAHISVKISESITNGKFLNSI